MTELSPPGPQQIPLALMPKADYQLSNFLFGDNQFLANYFPKQGLNWDFSLVLWGPEGVGLSHLAQAACHQAEQSGQSSVYLPLRELRALSPELLSGLEQMQLVCLDDLDAIAGQADWEEALFHLYNRMQARTLINEGGSQVRLLIMCHSALARINFGLADLKSRLLAAPSHRLQPLTEGQKKRVLLQRAEARGMRLTEELLAYVFTHSPRDMASLNLILSQLDQASLQEKRRLTIPFIKQVLNW